MKYKRASTRCASCDQQLGQHLRHRSTNKIGPICKICHKRIKNGGRLRTGDAYKKHRRTEIMKELHEYITRTNRLPQYTSRIPNMENWDWGPIVRDYFNVGIRALCASEQFQDFKKEQEASPS